MSRPQRAILPALLPAIVGTHASSATQGRQCAVRIATGFAAGLRVLAQRSGPGDAFALRAWAAHIDAECDLLAGLPAVAPDPKPAASPGGNLEPVRVQGVDQGAAAPATSPPTLSRSQP